MVPRWLVIFGLCLLWYSVSSTNSVVGKTLLNQFPYPLTLTMVQLLVVSVLSEPLLRLITRKGDINKQIYRSIIIPLACGKFLASVSSHISIWKVPVSYAHTIKATMPLFTVVITRVLFGEKQSKMIYFSLVPIVLGAVIASATEFSFDMIGLLSALAATCCFSLQHIFSKRVLKQTGVHQFQLLATLARLSFCLFSPVWLLLDARQLWMGTTELHDPQSICGLLILDALLNFFQNLIAFTVLRLVTPLTYAVAASAKRVAIIGVSLLLLRNPVSLSNAFGITIALSGVFIYNRGKYLEGLHRTELPTKQFIRAMVPRWLIIIALCLMWYSISSTNAVISKTLLTEFPYPLTLTIAQLFMVAILSEPLLRSFTTKDSIPIRIKYSIIIPLACVEFLGNVSSQISTWRMPVSYAHTIKATMPLFTVFIIRIIFGEKQTKMIYFSLIPIVLGAIIASATEFSFDVIGLIFGTALLRFSALTATCCFSVQYAFIKRVLTQTGVHQFQLMGTLARVGLCLFSPVWLMLDARQLWMGTTELPEPKSICWLLILNSILNFLQGLFAFKIITLVTPLTFAIASTARRVAVIAVSLFILRNPISLTNVLGIVLTLSGVFMYNRGTQLKGLNKLEEPLINPSKMTEILSL